MIGYIDPTLPASEQQAAQATLEQEILADLNYIEISIRSTATPQEGEPFHELSYFIDDLRLDDGRCIPAP